MGLQDRGDPATGGCSDRMLCVKHHMFNYFTTLITISPSSFCELVVSHCPLCSFPAFSHPRCVSGRYFRGWGCQPHMAEGGKSSRRAAWGEQLLNRLVTPWQWGFEYNILGFQGISATLTYGCKGSKCVLGTPHPCSRAEAGKSSEEPQEGT